MSWSEVNLKTDVARLHSKRYCLQSDIHLLVGHIKKLDVDSPRVRRFELLDAELNDKIADLKKANAALLSAYLAYGIGGDNDDLTSDQDELNTLVIDSCEAADTYRKLIDSKVAVKLPDPGAPPPPPPGLDGILSSINASQLLIADNIKKKKAPVVAQPSFHPHENARDFVLFKAFWSQFEIFVKPVPTLMQKNCSF